MDLKNCVLYYKDSCPFCQRVLHFMQKSNIVCEMKDTTIDENACELCKIGGKKQVPCLVIDGQAMYESLDIINYMNEKL